MPSHSLFIIIIPIFQMRKLRLIEVKYLAQGHTASKWQCQDLNLGSLSLETTLAMLYNTSLQDSLPSLSSPSHTWRVAKMETGSCHFPAPLCLPGSTPVPWPGLQGPFGSDAYLVFNLISHRRTLTSLPFSQSLFICWTIALLLSKPSLDATSAVMLPDSHRP